jgi:GNAT superfamily N-acetyltransferase
MDPSAFVIRHLEPGTPEIDVIARWRHEAFLKDYGLTLADRCGHLDALALRPPGEAALVAWRGDTPVGSCLLVREELDALHERSPWLASLYVIGSERGRGIGRLLVRAIEDMARVQGYRRVHLYTGAAEPFHAACGWMVEDRFIEDGAEAVLMSTPL